MPQTKTQSDNKVQHKENMCTEERNINKNPAQGKYVQGLKQKTRQINNKGPAQGIRCARAAQ